MTDMVDCQRCGTALTYGEVFRHQLAQDVASCGSDARRILGDHLSPRHPRQLCTPCRSEMTVDAVHRPAVKDKHWLMPVLSAFAGALVMAVILSARRG